MIEPTIGAAILGAALGGGTTLVGRLVYDGIRGGGKFQTRPNGDLDLIRADIAGVRTEVRETRAELRSDIEAMDQRLRQNADQLFTLARANQTSVAELRGRCDARHERLAPD